MSTPDSALFQLLPAVYRIRDGEVADSLGLARGPLESLLLVLEEQVAILADNLDQLYDDQFIETCAKWVVPYIGDLIGYQSVHGIASAVASPRAEVAHTIAFRRRKGTVLAMEQLARDVTGWGAHAVEFFLRLADTQYMNHIRPHSFYAPDLRHWKAGEYQNTGFDETAHTVDVRRIAIQRGRYNIPNIGIFLWPLNAYSVSDTPLTAVAAQPGGFRFSSLGRDIPLFNLGISQGPDIADPATPRNVSWYLTRHVLCRDITRIVKLLQPAEYYGDGLSLVLQSGGADIAPAAVRVCNLSGADGAWTNMPAAGDPISIDPELGRVAVPPGGPGNLTATYYYGFMADLGGGEYPRTATFTGSANVVPVRVPTDQPTVSAAIAAAGGDGIIEIEDSGIYHEPAGLNIAVNANGHIELRAADGSRPTLLVGDAITATGGAASQLDINGLVIAYEAGGNPLPPALITVPAGGGNALQRLRLTHMTVTPGWALNADGSPQAAYRGLPTVRVDAADVTLQATNAILGGVWVNAESAAELTNCIVDAASPVDVAYVDSIDPVTQAPVAGGALTMNGCTVIGKVRVGLLTLASDCIFWAWLTDAEKAAAPPVWRAALWATRRQQGCVRFSYLPEDAITPRRFECVEMGPGQPQPRFHSLRYGDPGYCELYAATDDLIRRGADDGGEMGVFHFLLAPLRESDLRIRMQEYLPAGLEFGVFYQD